MRSRTASIAVATLVLAIGLAACTSTSSMGESPTAPSTSPSTAPSMAGDMATFTSSSPAYSFRYPSSWREKGEVLVPSLFPAVPRTQQQLAVTLRESAVTGGVALTLDKVPPGATLDAYRGVVRRQLIRRGFTVASTRPAMMGDQPALVTRYTKVKWYIEFLYARFFTINGDHAYLLTYGTADKYFDSDYQAVVSMAESFSFGG